MATNKESEIKILNSQSAGATPDVSQMEYGELAINTADSKIYFKNGASSLGEIGSGGGAGVTASIPALTYQAVSSEESVSAGKFQVASSTEILIHKTDADSTDLTEFFEDIKFGQRGVLYFSDENDVVGLFSYTSVEEDTTYSNTISLTGNMRKTNGSFSSGDTLRVIIVPNDVRLPTPPGNRYIFRTEDYILNNTDWNGQPIEGECIGRAWNGDPDFLGVLSYPAGSEVDIDFGWDNATASLDEDADGNQDVQFDLLLQQLTEIGSSGNFGYLVITNYDDFSQKFVVSLTDAGTILSRFFTAGPYSGSNVQRLNWYGNVLTNSFDQGLDTSQISSIIVDWVPNYSGLIGGDGSESFAPGSTSGDGLYDGQTAGSLGTGDIAVSGSDPNFYVQISNVDNNGINRVKGYSNATSGYLTVLDMDIVGNGNTAGYGRSTYHYSSVTSDHNGTTGSYTFYTDYFVNGGLTFSEIGFGGTYSFSVREDLNNNLARQMDEIGVVNSFNGLTGDVEGVSSVNGQTGGVTAGGAGIRFTFEESVPSIGAGEICITSTVLAISDTSASGLGMTGALQDFNDAGGGSILVSDSSGDSVLYVSNIPASSITDEAGYWRFVLGDYDLINDEANMVQGEDVYLNLIPFSPSTITSSHTALLEFPDNKSYSLDAYTVADRTYNLFYGISVTGGCSADLVSGGTTLGSINISPSGASASFSTSVSAGSEVSVVISGVTTGTYLHDVRIVAGYVQ